MPLRTGILLTGAVPVGIGISGAVRGFANLGSAEEPVIAKAVPLPEILGEAYCALLCRSIGLPAPEPLILQSQDNGTLMFGSVDFGHPNCTKFLALDAADPDSITRWTTLLAKWDALPSVVAFDELINNRDRNPGNLLWSGQNEFALIDHGKAVGLDPGYPDGNRLVGYWLHSHGTDQLGCERLKRAALTFAQSFDQTPVFGAKSELMGVANEAALDHFVTFVIQRLENITNLISMRFPGSQLRIIP